MTSSLPNKSTNIHETTDSVETFEDEVSFSENNEHDIYDKERPYTTFFREQFKELLNTLNLTENEKQLLLRRNFKSLKNGNLPMSIDEYNIEQIKIYLADYGATWDFFSFFEKGNYLLNTTSYFESNDKIYLNNKIQTEKFLETVASNHVATAQNEKRLVSMSQLFGQGKTFFMNTLKNKERMCKYDWNKYPFDNYVLKCEVVNEIKPLSFKTLEDAKAYLKMRIHNIMFNHLLPGIQHKDYFEYFYQNRLYEDIEKYVKVPSNTHIIYSIDEIGALLNVSIEDESLSPFETSVILAYFLWNELAKYQKIQKTTIAVIGRGTPFVYFGKSKLHSPTRNKHIHLKLLNEEDIKALLKEHISKKKEDLPSEEKLDEYSKKILDKSCAIPRAILECLKYYPNFDDIRDLEALSDNYRSNHLLLYHFINSHEKFDKKTVLSLNLVNELLYGKPFMDKQLASRFNVPIYSLFDNLGIAYRVDEQFVYPVVPKSFLGGKYNVYYRLMEMAKGLSPAHTQEILSTRQLVALAVSQFKSLKFLEQTTLLTLPEIPQSYHYKQLNIDSTWDESDYNDFYSNITRDKSTVFTFSQTSSSADEILGFLALNKDQTFDPFLVCVQDKHYINKELTPQGVLDELNKFAGLITHKKNARILGFINSLKKKHFHAKFLKKNIFETKHIGWKFDLKEFLIYAKKFDPNKKKWKHLYNISFDNFDAYVLTGQEDLKEFYGKDMTKEIYKEPKLIEELMKIVIEEQLYL